MRAEHVEKIMASPSNLKELPQPIQKYYQLELNKDFYRLAQLQNTIVDECMIGPIPCLDEFDKKKGNKIYKSLFSHDLDSLDLGQADIWYDEGGNLFKKSGIFIKSFKQIEVNDLKDYLKKQIIEDDEIGEIYKDDENYKQIVSLEKQIISKINKI